MSSKNRSQSKDKKAASKRHSDAYNRLYMGTTSSKMKEKPAFNTDTRIAYEDNAVSKPIPSKKGHSEKEDFGKSWTDSLRS